MDTAEMRLLTVPQFARRVSCSVDEALALIANKDVKALRPDLEGGYRVLETEVDRLLQERTTRIKPTGASLGSESSQAVSRLVGMETHLTAVTALEVSRLECARQERLNTALQGELFLYRKLGDEEKERQAELRARLEAAEQQFVALKIELAEREARVKALQQENKRLLEGEAVNLSEQQNAPGRSDGSWWRRFVKKFF